MNIIIVDDEKRIREGMFDMIASSPFAVENLRTAVDADDAIEQLSLCPADLILTDISMPGTDGLDMVEALRKMKPDIIVIIITGYDRFSYAKRAIELGASGFLLKPVERKELYSLLSKAEENINKKTADKLRSEWLKREFEDDLPIYRNRLFNKILEGKIEADELEVSLRTLKLDVFFSGWLCIVENRINDDVAETEFGFSEEDNLFLKTSSNGNIIVLLAGEGWKSISKEQVKNYLSGYSILTIRNVELGWHRLQESYNSIITGIRRIDSRIARSAINLIENYYCRVDFSLKKAAEMLNISPSYLSREFKKNTGQVFMDALNEYRIRIAADELEKAEPGIKIYEIAERCGFRSQHYFSRIFHNSTGMSPIEFRKSVRR